MKNSKQIVAEYKGIEEHQIAGRNQMLAEAIKEYAKQKCRHQKQLCEEQFQKCQCKGSDFCVSQRILNASEPEFD